MDKTGIIEQRLHSAQYQALQKFGDDRIEGDASVAVHVQRVLAVALVDWYSDACLQSYWNLF